MLDLLTTDYGKRSVGIWEQELKETRLEIVNTITKHMGYRNIGISVSAYVNGDTILLFLPFDFDSTNLKETYEDSKRLFQMFIDWDITCYWSFSGCKGFHVIVEVEPKDYPNKQVGLSQIFFKELLGLKTMDRNLFGDKKRLIRIPWTWNINGTWCKLLAWHDGKKLNLDEIVVNEHRLDKSNINKSNNDDIRIYHRPCIEYLVRDKSYWIKNHPRGSFEPTESIRLSWAGMRIWAGKTIEEIIEEARAIGWDDFDEEYMIKKLEYLIDKKWTPHSCGSLKEMGYCINEVDCRYKWS